ncbi:lipopolysaccharide kinase InaA family protein [Cobetia sp. L2A1]|uniref:lipopolysaccharide kinase InaA family protein n=1 Tax=Cobetia sp. L2A1 TaxID=2686360 RepID=UPI00131D853E|nr:lipopolysaccharide kinase InaA family protein [Cobetia sp. L2A1]
MTQLPALSPSANPPRGHADYCESELAKLLARHELNSFEHLWQVAAENVDIPNRERGGVSTVSLLTLEDEKGQRHRLYLKRQTNHLARSVVRPLGEPTFSREWRAIRRYHSLGIPSVEAGWYGERKQGKHWRAILITFDLTNRDDLDSWHVRWPELDDEYRRQVITASARLVRQIHQAGMMHGCLFPKHLFLNRPDTFTDARQQMDAVIIDLEKTRRFVLRRHECLRDLYVLWRRLTCWQQDDWRQFLAIYCDSSPKSTEVDRWLSQLEIRGQRKRR